MCAVLRIEALFPQFSHWKNLTVSNSSASDNGQIPHTATLDNGSGD